MDRHKRNVCRCGAAVIWGDAATEEDVAAWAAEHRACLPLKIRAREVCPTRPPYQYLVEDVTGAQLLTWIEHVDVEGRPVEIVVLGPVLDAGMALANVRVVKEFLLARRAASVVVYARAESAPGSYECALAHAGLPVGDPGGAGSPA
jgi:hypothetical protein